MSGGEGHIPEKSETDPSSRPVPPYTRKVTCPGCSLTKCFIMNVKLKEFYSSELSVVPQNVVIVVIVVIVNVKI